MLLIYPQHLLRPHQPVDPIIVNENKLLLIFERAGQALCTVLVVIFQNYNYHGLDWWAVWLGVSALLMILYLICWVRYFRGGHLTKDVYRSFCGIPLPLAVLPVASALFLSVYGKVVSLTIASVILGIGHIWITAQHWSATKKR